MCTIESFKLVSLVNMLVLLRTSNPLLRYIQSTYNYFSARGFYDTQTAILSVPASNSNEMNVPPGSPGPSTGPPCGPTPARPLIPPSATRPSVRPSAACPLSLNLSVRQSAHSPRTASPSSYRRPLERSPVRLPKVDKHYT